jgi:hypothetical protein
VLYLVITAGSTLLSYYHFSRGVASRGILGAIAGFLLGVVVCLTIASYLAESLEYFCAFLAVILTWFAAASSWRPQQ